MKSVDDLVKEDLGRLVTYLGVAAIAVCFQVTFHLSDIWFYAIFIGITVIIWWKKGLIFKKRKK